MKTSIFVAALCIFLSVQSPANAADVSKCSAENMRAAPLNEPFTVPFTLAELSIKIDNQCAITVHVSRDVYRDGFSASTLVFLPTPDTIGQALDDFTIAAGLHWKMRAHSIHIYRKQPENAPSK